MQWDARVLAWLDEMAAAVRACGLVSLVERTVAAVWERNIERYDPDAAGDTPTSLGITSSENIRTLLLREDQDAWSARGVLITSVQQALVLEVAGREVLLMKVADRRLDPDGPAELDWATTRWDTASDIRRRAAEANALRYEPPVERQSGQLWWPELGRPPALDRAGPGGPGDDPMRLRHLVLVWAGDPSSATTSGWLGVPYAGPSGALPAAPWLAAVSLWHHGPHDVPRPREPVVAVPRPG